MGTLKILNRIFTMKFSPGENFFCQFHYILTLVKYLSVCVNDWIGSFQKCFCNTKAGKFFFSHENFQHTGQKVQWMHVQEKFPVYALRTFTPRLAPVTFLNKWALHSTVNLMSPHIHQYVLNLYTANFPITIPIAKCMINKSSCHVKYKSPFVMSKLCASLLQKVRHFDSSLSL